MRLIDADALTKRLIAFCNKNCPYTAKERNVMCDSCFMGLALEAVEDAPTIEERKKGKWNFIGDNMFECTCCGTPYTTQQFNGLRNYNTDPYAPNFCPYCGSYNGDDMDDIPDDIPIEYFENGGK